MTTPSSKPGRKKILTRGNRSAPESGARKRFTRFEIPRGASDEDLQKLADAINAMRRKHGHSSKE